MKRRAFFTALGGLCLSPLAASLQQTKMVGKTLEPPPNALARCPVTLPLRSGTDKFGDWKTLGTWDLVNGKRIA